MITIFFVGEAGHFFLAGGSLYPLNTLDRILTGIWDWLTDADLTGGWVSYVVQASNIVELVYDFLDNQEYAI